MKQIAIEPTQYSIENNNQPQDDDYTEINATFSAFKPRKVLPQDINKIYF